MCKHSNVTTEGPAILGQPQVAIQWKDALIKAFMCLSQ